MSSILDLFGLDDEPVVQSAPVRTPTPTKPKVVRPPKPVGEPVMVSTPQPTVDVGQPDDPVVPSTVCAKYLDCGHLNWHTDESNAIAEAEGHCCANGKNKHLISWQYLRGKYVRPLPMQSRRTVDKERMGGFPGYCCDDDGFYIGGIGNDCRHHGPDGKRCVVHRIVPKSKFIDEEVVEVAAPDTEPEIVIEPDPQESAPTPMPTASGGSWKQRQLSAKRGRR